MIEIPSTDNNVIELPQSNCIIIQDERGHYSVRFYGESQFEHTLSRRINLPIQSSVDIGGIGLTWRTIENIDKIFPTMQAEISSFCSKTSLGQAASVMILGNGLSSLPTDLLKKFGKNISITVLDIVDLVKLEEDLSITEFAKYIDRRVNISPYNQLRSFVDQVHQGQIEFIHGALTTSGIVSVNSSLVNSKYNVVINCFGPAVSTFSAQLNLTGNTLFSNQVPDFARLPNEFEIEPMKGMEGRVIRTKSKLSGV